MKIESAHLEYRSRRTYTEQYKSHERFSLTRFEPGETSPTIVKSKACVDKDDANRTASTPQTLKADILLALLERLTGKKFKLVSIDDVKKAVTPDADLGQIANAMKNAQQQPSEPLPDFSLEYDFSDYYHEEENTSFEGKGIIQTSDGRQIDFSVSLNMSRQYTESNELHIRAGRAALKDPLVINFNGTAAQLSESRFKFDIDADGALDEINYLAPGSAFLALDRNGDGRINDGSELFGPATGNGFTELAQFDADHNGFIDENDAIFAQLRLWTRDENQRDALYDLKEANVGAIHLNAIETPFALKDRENELRGQIVRSGVYLTEDGNVGTVQQIDLSV